jgi:hypothetical protein
MIQLDCHPAERRQRSGSVIVACCGCCCCCCCLHTVGSLAGAAVAPIFGKKRDSIGARYRLLVEEYELEDQPGGETAAPEFRRKAKMSAVALYWWLVAAFSALPLGYGVLIGLSEPRIESTLVITLVLMALGMPLIQLAASLVAGVVLVASLRDDKGYQLLQLGKITLGSIVGTVAGVLAMVGIASLVGAFH